MPRNEIDVTSGPSSYSAGSIMRALHFAPRALPKKTVQARLDYGEVDLELDPAMRAADAEDANLAQHRRTEGFYGGGGGREEEGQEEHQTLFPSLNSSRR